MEDNRYGYGQNPPYSLYQGEDGKWGLVDKDGVKLNAVFTRSQDGDVFSCALGEVVYFDENEGFNLLAWCDPDEAWFNFTYDNDEYPSRWCYLLSKSEPKEFPTYFPLYRENLPEKDRWLIEAIGYFFTRIHEIDSISDFDKEESEFEELKADIKNRYPKIEQYAMTSLMLAPILDNLQIEEDARVALWENKVYLDSIYHE